MIRRMLTARLAACSLAILALAYVSVPLSGQQRRAGGGQAVDRAVFPGMQGGPLVHAIAAKAACFKIAASEPFRDYQRQIRANADVQTAYLGEPL